MTTNFSAEEFEAVRGTSFRTRADDVGLPDLRLESVDRFDAPAGAPRRDPFALVFVGPQPALEQRIYTLSHTELGEVDIFLVPIGLDADGSVRYEAVFN
jgi:hypothetical protein